VNRGADGYTVKPFRMDDLLNTVKEHLRKQQDARKQGRRKSEDSSKRVPQRSRGADSRFFAHHC
jgi:DNA-binding response OmpR family regulator